ncbi:hypothetical protein VNO80_19111 [Phaseolus coccineus]|uniref:Uncharacterized protein n=1 Tax=Phaseolus coccineus TaxID=3886 RepID=A0AAN9QX12_PHACN
MLAAKTTLANWTWGRDTLVLWYPGVGRLWLNQSDGKLNLWCNNHDAIKTEAETSANISQHGDLYKYTNLFEKLVYKTTFDGNFSNIQLFVLHAWRTMLNHNSC